MSNTRRAHLSWPVLRRAPSAHRRRRLSRRADRGTSTWAPGTFGVAPTSYVLNVTGLFVGGFSTTGRALSGTVGPGSYTLSVVAVNPCGASAGSPPQTVVVP